MSYSAPTGPSGRDPWLRQSEQSQQAHATTPAGQPRPGRPVNTEAARLERDRGWTTSLALLIARLNGLAQQGNFTHQDAAALFLSDGGTDGDRPPPYHVATDTGEWQVDRRKVSAQMSPRDKCSPPDADLVDNFVTLSLRANPDTDPRELRRAINALYQDAVHDAEARRRAQQHRVDDIRQQLAKLKDDLSVERRVRAKLTKDRDRAVARYKQISVQLDASSQRVHDTEQQLRDHEVALASLARDHVTELAAEQTKVRQLKDLLTDMVNDHEIERAGHRAMRRHLEAQLQAERETAERLRSAVQDLRAQNALLVESAITQTDDSYLERALQKMLADLQAGERQLASLGAATSGSSVSRRVPPGNMTPEYSALTPPPTGDQGPLPQHQSPSGMPPRRKAGIFDSWTNRQLAIVIALTIAVILSYPFVLRLLTP